MDCTWSLTVPTIRDMQTLVMIFLVWDAVDQRGGRALHETYLCFCARLNVWFMGQSLGPHSRRLEFGKWTANNRSRGERELRMTCATAQAHFWERGSGERPGMAAASPPNAPIARRCSRSDHQLCAGFACSYNRGLLRLVCSHLCAVEGCEHGGTLGTVFMRGRCLLVSMTRSLRM